MILIGVTGVVGSGKTTVSDILKRKGLEIIDLDKTAKEIVEREDVKRAIERELGSRCISGGKIDVGRVRELVFEDREALRRLEGIVHPRVLAQMHETAKALGEQGAKAVIVDAPLLFEKGLDRELDKTVVVSASPEKIKERLKKRGMEENDMRRRTAIQMSLKDKEKLADYVVHNDGTIENLEKEVDNLLNTIKGWEVELHAS